MMIAMRTEDEPQQTPDEPRRTRAASQTYPRRGRTDEKPQGPDLCRCKNCDSTLVQPLDWSLVGRSHWRVTLRCPNCEWTATDVFDQESVDRYDRDLDRGTRKLTHTLARIARACMEAEVKQFANALDTELIQPFDF